MRRVVVPLDGTKLAVAILPDACRLAGPEGELILIHDASRVPYYGTAYVDAEAKVMEASRDYLNRVAVRLRADGVKVQTQTMVMGNASVAIDEAARIFRADMIAVATHARGPLGRLVHGSTAWHALTHSPVPVLVRHVRENEDGRRRFRPLERRILVPLDGSPFAEMALPLAQQLASEWNTEIRLTEVIRTMTAGLGIAALGMAIPADADTELARREAESYLCQVAGRMHGDVHQHVLVGSPVDHLITAVKVWGISDIVMASHGRTGLSRVMVGSIADALIHRLDLPIIMVPALAASTLNWSDARAQRWETSVAPV